MGEFLAALAVSAALTGVAVPLLRADQFMDVPNHRSSHSAPVPRGGGVAVVLTLALLGAWALPWNVPTAVLLLLMLAHAAVGLVDDLRSLPSTVRLLAQVLGAGAFAAVALAEGSASWWWFPVLAVAVAGYVNAYNFMDGVNGISALTAAVVGAHWAWVGHAEDQQLFLGAGLVLLGAALGFLPWNAPRAKVFLGDVGSYGIGFFIVGLSVLAVSEGLPWQWALAPLVVYGADTGWVLVKRFRGGRSLTEAHREHVYQRLVDGGWPHLASAGWCALASATVCGLALVRDDLQWWQFPLALVAVLAYLISPVVLLRRTEAAV